jgi:uncharacterized protein (TIGR03118 family)
MIKSRSRMWAVAATVSVVVAATVMGNAALAAGTEHSAARDGDARNRGTPRFAVINQVSDQKEREPAIVDPDVVNSWGLALGPTSPLWVTNNGTNTATVYRNGVNGAPVKKADLTVHIPGGAPTGEAFNNTNDFDVPGPGGSKPARFIFVSEGGDITAWNPNAGTEAVQVAHVDGAIYKGVALLKTKFGNFLLAADFHNARIDVFDEDFKQVDLLDCLFRDKRLPKGYAPFNVLTVGERVYVAYAKQDANAKDEVVGAGLGFVDLYKGFGRKVQRIASRGTLNAPWGLAIAPDGFGRFTGDLLVGNFGDGRINAFDHDDFEGQLRDERGQKITIDGLWALLPGTETTGGERTLWFSAGPDEEKHGLVGQLIPATK